MPGMPDELPADLHEVPVIPDVLPEAACLHRPIAFDWLEQILAKDAAVYLKDQ